MRFNAARHVPASIASRKRATALEQEGGSTPTTPSASSGPHRTHVPHADLDLGGETPDGPAMKKTSSIVSAMEGAGTFASRLTVRGKILLDSMVFQGLIGGLVMLNTLQMGLEAEFPNWTTIWRTFENIFTLAFFIEMFGKIMILRREYFRDRWNWLDFMLVWMAVFDTWVMGSIASNGGDSSVDLQSLSVLRTLRMVRLVRVLKLAKQCTRIVIIINGVVDAIRTTLWVGLLLLGAIYVCAIFCVDFIGRPTDPTIYPGFTTDPAGYDELEVINQFNPYLAFGTMPQAMLTLFNIAILAEWAEVIRPISVKQPELVVFFIVFVLFITFGVMNVIIGLIVDNVMENARNMQSCEQEESKARRRKLVESIKREFIAVDGDGTGYISLSEMSRSCSDKDGLVNKLMGQMGVRFDFDEEELFAILDADGDGKIGADEFCNMFYHLVSADVFKLVCMVQMSMNQMKNMMKMQMDRLEKIEEASSGHVRSNTSPEHLATNSVEVRPAQKCHSSPADSGYASEKRKLEQAEAVASSSTGCASPVANVVPLVRADPLLDHAEESTMAGDTDCQEFLDAKGLELEMRIGRALDKLKRVDEERQLDDKHRRQLEDLSGCLDAVRLEVEDAIQSKVRETLAGCLGAVRRAMEDSAVLRGDSIGGCSGAASSNRGEVVTPLRSRSPTTEAQPAQSAQQQQQPQGELQLIHPVTSLPAEQVGSRPPANSRELHAMCAAGLAREPIPSFDRILKNSL